MSDDTEFHEPREIGIPIRSCTSAEPHPGHRWVEVVRSPGGSYQRRAIVWCSGVSELVARLSVVRSGTLEPTKEAHVSIADESARPPSPGINAEFMRQNAVQAMSRTERQARYAYYAWGNILNGRWPVPGIDHRPLPDWDHLPPQLRHAWIEAARAVRSDTLNPDWARTTQIEGPAAPWNRVPRGGELP